MKIGTSPKSYDISAKPVQVKEATVSSKDGVLTIQAGDAGTKIHVQHDYLGLHVKVGDQELHFKKGEYPKGIDIRGGKGDDDIKVDWMMPVPVRVDGGEGKDTYKNWNAGTEITDSSGASVVENAGEKAKIKVGDESNVTNIFGHGSSIEVGRNARVMNDTDDTFVRAGKGLDLANFGYRNTIELSGPPKKTTFLGTDNRIVYIKG